MIKLGIYAVSALYFICFQLMPKDVDGFYVNVFNPMPGGAAEYRSANKRAYEDLQNIEGMTARITNDAIKIIYNSSASEGKRTFNKLNEMTYSMDGSIAGKLSNSDRQLGSFITEVYEANKEYAMKDENSICGVEETIKINFIENGIKKTERLRLKLGYVPLIKAFKIVDMDFIK